MKAAEASSCSPLGVGMRWISSELHFFPPFLPPVRLNLHAHSGLLAVMIQGYSPLTNHMLMLAVQMKGAGVGYLEKDQQWRGPLVPLVRQCDGGNDNKDIHTDL